MIGFRYVFPRTAWERGQTNLKWRCLMKLYEKYLEAIKSLDDLITAQSQKVEALKQHKKGLMQQLFPNNNKETL